MNTLAALNAAGPWLDQRATADVAIGVLGSLRALHGAGSVVGNLSPGIVTVRDDSSVLIGTPDPSDPIDPRYAAPELRDLAAATAADDLYAVGAMLYEMLSGHTPTPQPGGATHRDLVELRPDTDPQLVSIVNKALAVDPALRYQDAETFRADLIAARPSLPTVPARTAERVVVPSPPPSRVGPALAIAALILVGLGVLLYFLLRGDDRAVVPAVAGQPAALAQKTLTNAGFRTTLAQEANDRFDTGTAIRTDPPEGTRVATGGSVVLVIDGEPAARAVPSVVGQQDAAAQVILAKAGFNAASTQVSDGSPPGTVVGQSPGAGQASPAGATVTLRVSSGPRTTTVTKTVTTPGAQPAPAPAPAQVRVPSVVGQTVDAASRTLTGAGLSVGTITRRPSTDSPPDTVLNQNPPAGSRTDSGGQVALTVSAAP